ncbi:ATP-binding protein [Oceanicola sp. S124]|uniref:ATP-binding protein n=1 Tax=Oceanicola sp. S124 TaxID=1042378 RepID=UPI0014390B25|nr:ATP-binding protein [Oceanicola sp. S124]
MARRGGISGEGAGPLAWLRRRLGASGPVRDGLDALEALPTAIVISDGYGRPLGANRAARDLAGGGALDAWLYDAPFHDPESRGSLRPAERPMARLLADTGLVEVYAALMDAEGSEQILRFTRTILPGPPARLVVCIEDGAALWHLHRRGEATDRLESIGQLSGGIAHDMANLLGVIRLSADALTLTGKDAANTAAVASIQAACDRGGALIDHLLAIARREDGARSEIEIAPFLDTLRQLIRRTTPAHLRLEVDGGPEGLVVTCDRGGLENALLNLAINARNALQDQGTAEGLIRIAARRGGGAGMVQFDVTDDGPGMQPAVLERATEAFFSTRARSGGTGLGLAMVSTFAEVSGGSMRIESAPGEGTRVVLTLPVEGPADSPAVAEAQEVSLAGLRLLVVEDDPLFGEVLSQALHLSGAEVTLVPEAGPALAAAQDFTPDLLITDIVLPGPLNGHQLAQQLRQRHPDLRVIYVSGYAAPSHLPGDHVPGAFLRKPVSVATMTNTIARSLGRAAT